MSVHIVSKVWRIETPLADKIILLKLADHADDDGMHIFPSVRRLAAECCASERKVQTTLRRYEANGLLVKTQDHDARRMRPAVYRFDMERLDAWPKVSLPERRAVDCHELPPAPRAPGARNAPGTPPAPRAPGAYDDIDPPHHVHPNLHLEPSKKEGREGGEGAPGDAIGHEASEPGFSLRAEAQPAPKRNSKPKASPEQWDAFRRAYPDRGTNPNGRSRPMGWPEAEARFHALIRAGEASADDLIAAARAYAESCEGMRDRESVQQAATFLGPRKQTWREFIEVARQPRCGAAISGAKVEDDERWQRRLTYHFEPHPIIVEKHGPRPWDDTWGPPPGEPGCRVPPHILEHFCRPTPLAHAPASAPEAPPKARLA